jgi:hypothetical protein
MPSSPRKRVIGGFCHNRSCAQLQGAHSGLMANNKTTTLMGAGRDVKIPPKSDPKHGEMRWIVSENGTVRGWNEKSAVEVTLTPSARGGDVTWTCKGYPASAMPGSCGGRG